jgi:hypothetical protein
LVTGTNRGVPIGSVGSSSKDFVGDASSRG